MDLLLSGIVSDIIASKLPHVVVCAQEVHRLWRKRIQIDETVKPFYNYIPHLIRLSGLRSWDDLRRGRKTLSISPKSGLGDAAKYNFTAGLQKNPEAGGKDCNPSVNSALSPQSLTESLRETCHNADHPSLTSIFCTF